MTLRRAFLLLLWDLNEFKYRGTVAGALKIPKNVDAYTTLTTTSYIKTHVFCLERQSDEEREGETVGKR